MRASVELKPNEMLQGCAVRWYDDMGGWWEDWIEVRGWVRGQEAEELVLISSVCHIARRPVSSFLPAGWSFFWFFWRLSKWPVSSVVFKTYNCMRIARHSLDTFCFRFRDSLILLRQKPPLSFRQVVCYQSDTHISLRQSSSGECCVNTTHLFSSRLAKAVCFWVPRGQAFDWRTLQVCLP